MVPWARYCGPASTCSATACSARRVATRTCSSMLSSSWRRRSGTPPRRAAERRTRCPPHGGLLCPSARRGSGPGRPAAGRRPGGVRHHRARLVTGDAAGSAGTRAHRRHRRGDRAGGLDGRGARVARFRGTRDAAHLGVPDPGQRRAPARPRWRPAPIVELEGPTVDPRPVPRTRTTRTRGTGATTPRRPPGNRSPRCWPRSSVMCWDVPWPSCPSGSGPSWSCATCTGWSRRRCASCWS